jgi:hypothetical protein
MAFPALADAIRELIGYHKKVRIVYERPAVCVPEVNQQFQEARSGTETQRKGFT